MVGNLAAFTFKEESCSETLLLKISLIFANARNKLEKVVIVLIEYIVETKE